MKIFELAAEMAPFTQAGGLGRSMDGLAKGLAKSGSHVMILSPYTRRLYDTEGTKSFNSKVVYTKKSNPPDKEKGTFSIREHIANSPQVSNYFYDNSYYFRFRDLYRHGDDNARFYSFSLGAVSWLKELIITNKWIPDIIHCHDWHTGYFVELAKRSKEFKSVFKNIPIIFTVHNFKYQNSNRVEYMPSRTEDNPSVPLSNPTKNSFETQNSLIRGLKYADVVSTVSNTHKTEILNEKYYFNLTSITQATKGKFHGILNGVDYQIYKPKNPVNIKYTYSQKDATTVRQKNKLYLQSKLHLPKGKDKFLMTFIGRLFSQKGVDLMIECIPRFLKTHPDAEIILLGGGEESILDKIWEIKNTYSNQVAFSDADFGLPQTIYSGADVILIPSFFEPCGNVAQEALAYGCVPIVNGVGGLNEIVTNFNTRTLTGNGFKFTTYSSHAFYKEMCEAYSQFKQKPIWTKLVSNTFDYRWSWEESAELYLNLFKSVSLKK